MNRERITTGSSNSWGAERRNWHLDKTISVGHLLSTVVIAASVFAWASAVDRRVEQNTQSIDYIKLQQNQEAKRLSKLRDDVQEMINRIEKRLDLSRTEIKTDLRDINGKLDRLIEKQIGK